MTADPLQQWPVPKPGERPLITPGPWGIASETNGTEMVAYSVNPWRVRAVLVRGDFMQNPNWRADTKAMAATPQLVEALLAVRQQASAGDRYSLNDRRVAFLDNSTLAKLDDALRAAGVL